MPSPVQVAELLVVAMAGLAVVWTREPVRQTVVVGFFGLQLAVLFFTFQAPDVALSALAVSSVALPLMLLLALARMRRGRR
ncbi:MAG TPA: hydrogenase subunit MbhD domain-containing protein [Candidatus Dormibacteraeota bacterium]|nr:hydrogenase subunit MbhD domain-containing protein [Candidatus Dormibacteraeota bacterium]